MALCPKRPLLSNEGIGVGQIWVKEEARRKTSGKRGASRRAMMTHLGGENKPNSLVSDIGPMGMDETETPLGED